MTRINNLPVWVSITFFLVLTSCTHHTRITNEIIHIEGVTSAFNITTSFVLFGSTCESEEQAEVRLPATDGDLIYILNEDGSGFYYRYNTEEGNHLVASHDTLKPHLFFINGMLSQFEVTREGIYRLEEELKALKPGRFPTLLISDSLTGEMIMELNKLKENTGGSGILINHDISTGIFEDLISICRPTWLVMDSLPAGSGTDRGRLPKELELLYINGEPLLFTGDDPCQGNLESLIIEDWQPVQDEMISLSALKKLHTLTLADCDIPDLSPIQFPRRLQRLFLVGCEEFTDIGRISEIPDLRSFGITFSDVASLVPVMELENLTRMAFPENTTQDVFASVIDRLPLLEVVELSHCQEIHDLSPLQQSGHLEILILRTESVLPEHVGSLDQLELIILSEEVFEDSPELVSELRTQLPNTMIVPGSGLCLGSGWLLLILPIVIAARFLFRRK